MLNSYRQGVATGILKALKELTEKKAQETKGSTAGSALVVAKAQAIAEAYGKHPTRVSKVKLARSSGAFVAGVQDGSAVDVGRRAVTGNTSSTLRLA